MPLLPENSVQRTQFMLFVNEYTTFLGIQILLSTLKATLGGGVRLRPADTGADAKQKLLKSYQYLNRNGGHDGRDISG